MCVKTKSMPYINLLKRENYFYANYFVRGLILSVCEPAVFKEMGKA